MSFTNIWQFFISKVDDIMVSNQEITSHHIEEVSDTFKMFGQVNFNCNRFDSKKEFSRLCVYYYLFIKKYSSQRDMQDLIVRKAFASFLYVFDMKHEICLAMLVVFQRWVDFVPQQVGKDGNLKELLRIYSYLLNKIHPKFLKDVGNKHKNLSDLYAIMKDTNNIETQALIIEVVLKLGAFNSSLRLNVSFWEILRKAGVFSRTNCNIYRKILMVLNQVNETSAKIFSISCSTILVDDRRLVEFPGAVDDDNVWFNVDLQYKKICIFCERNFADSLGKIGFYNAGAPWEVLCLPAQDIHFDFRYEPDKKSFKIAMLLDKSNFGIFENEEKRKIEVWVPIYCKKFEYFILRVLPIIFDDKNMNSKTLINFIQKTYDIRLLNDTCLVNEHFQLRKRKCPEDQRVPATSSDSQASSVVAVPSRRYTKLSTKTPRKNSVFCGYVNKKGRRPFEPIVNKNDKKFKEWKSGKLYTFKIVRQSNTAVSKSVSPLSFTKSTISQPPQQILEIRKKEKVSTFREVNDIPAATEEENIVSRTISLTKNVEKDLEETQPECTTRDCFNSSITKVEHWLEGLDFETSCTDDEITAIRELEQNLLSVSAQNSERGSSVLTPEERIAKLMGELEQITKPSTEGILSCTPFITDKELLNTLADQELLEEKTERETNTILPLGKSPLLEKKSIDLSKNKCNKSSSSTSKVVMGDILLEVDEISQEALGKENNTTEVCHKNNNAATSPKNITKRNLYNPDDLSYLQRSLSEDYFLSKGQPTVEPKVKKNSKKNQKPSPVQVTKNKSKENKSQSKELNECRREDEKESPQIKKSTKAVDKKDGEKSQQSSCNGPVEPLLVTREDNKHLKKELQNENKPQNKNVRNCILTECQKDGKRSPKIKNTTKAVVKKDEKKWQHSSSNVPVEPLLVTREDNKHRKKELQNENKPQNKNFGDCILNECQKDGKGSPQIKKSTKAVDKKDEKKSQQSSSNVPVETSTTNSARSKHRKEVENEKKPQNKNLGDSMKSDMKMNKKRKEKPEPSPSQSLTAKRRKKDDDLKPPPKTRILSNIQLSIAQKPVECKRPNLSSTEPLEVKCCKKDVEHNLTPKIQIISNTEVNPPLVTEQPVECTRCLGVVKLVNDFITRFNGYMRVNC